MRESIGHYSWARVCAVSIIGIYLIYNIPFITNISLSQTTWETIWTEQDSLFDPIVKSVLLALGQTVILLSSSLIISILLFKLNLLSSGSKYLGILLIPFVLGNVSVAFIFKLFLLDNQWPFTSPLTKFISLTYIQFWQYGSLFIYLFWLNQQTIAQSVWDYANAVKLNDYEKIKHILIPKQRNLMVLLFMISFILCFYETSKIEFIFKASRGTSTELVNQWLNRTYHSDTLLNANFAFTHLSQSAFYVLLTAFLVLIIGLFLQNKTILLWTRSRNTFNLQLLPSAWLSKIVCILLIF